MKYAEMTREQLEKEYSVIRARYDRLCEEKLSLNLTRGKPEKKQNKRSRSRRSFWSFFRERTGTRR